MYEKERNVFPSGSKEDWPRKCTLDNWTRFSSSNQSINQSGTRVKSSCICVGLDPRDWQTIIVVWYQWMGYKWCGKHGVRINRLFFKQGFVGQQLGLKQCSKSYWQPMKGTKQCKARLNGGNIVTRWAIRFWTTEAVCGQCRWYHKKWIAIIETTEHKTSCK